MMANYMCCFVMLVFYFKQKTAYEMRISDWSSDVCTSDLEPMPPHSLTMTMIGSSLLWVGWFGFNAGSNLEANAVTGVAFINTMVATCAAAVSWSLVEQVHRSEEHTSELQSLMRISYAVFCLKKNTQQTSTLSQSYTNTRP